MKYGKKKVANLKQSNIQELLQDIVDSCVEYAGDSYESFARDVTGRLKRHGLVDYGYEGPEQKNCRFVPQEITDGEFAGTWAVYDTASRSFCEMNKVYKLFEDAKEAADKLFEISLSHEEHAFEQ